ncbi:unnamed protein product [Soboliphyme baturini]|uniref:BTB domain-containing protein n=1 Tax=Soboliphyme baturini TaxID=241478 RepID=A0A183J391_9BILA|nr:unnamed protein product [Soboliphyme baturini]
MKSVLEDTKDDQLKGTMNPCTSVRRSLSELTSKKDVALIFNNLLRRQIGTRSPTVEYLCTRPDILITLIKGYEIQEIALNCGSMLRESIRHEPLARIMLNSDEVYRFFSYVEMSTFDVASDAFSTFKVSTVVSYFCLYC